MTDDMKILLVEDDLTLWGLVEEVFAPNPVVCVENTESAWEILADVKNPVRIAIIDQHLSGEPGIEFCRYLREQYGSKGDEYMEVALFTGDKSSALALEAAGCNVPLIHKGMSFDISSLLALKNAYKENSGRYGELLKEGDDLHHADFSLILDPQDFKFLRIKPRVASTLDHVIGTELHSLAREDDLSFGRRELSFLYICLRYLSTGDLCVVGNRNCMQAYDDVMHSFGLRKEFTTLYPDDDFRQAKRVNGTSVLSNTDSSTDDDGVLTQLNFKLLPSQDEINADTTLSQITLKDNVSKALASQVTEVMGRIARPSTYSEKDRARACILLGISHITRTRLATVNGRSLFKMYDDVMNGYSRFVPFRNRY